MIGSRGLAILAVLALCAGEAVAHHASIVYATVRVDRDEVVWELAIADSDLGVTIGRGEAVPTEVELEHDQAVVLAYVAPKLRVRRGASDCTRGQSTLGSRPRSAGYAAVVTVPFQCPRNAAPFWLGYDLFFEVDARHQAIVTLAVGGATLAESFTSGRRELVVSGDGLVKSLVQFVGLGVEHILSGFDHLAFLAALLLALLLVEDARLLRDGLRTITAFTAAHSLTLLGAAFGVLRLPSYWVEATIALSIVTVALGNLRRRTPRARWAVTFGFGLVHGLGFASVLGETPLPRDAVTSAVLAFNLGVELGQLGVLVGTLPLLVWLRRRSEATRRRVVDAASILLAVLGGGWLVLRLLG